MNHPLPYEVLERASIKEFCGNMSRSVAEQQALDEWMKSQKEEKKK